MKITIFRGNPRKNGYTEYITNLVKEGALSAGANVIDVDLTKKKIKACTGCYHCWTVTPGKCIFDDDVNNLLDLMLESDIILWSTPIYHYNVSAVTKTFLERTLPISKQGFVITPKGLIRNKIRYPEKWKNKKIGFISAAAFKSTKIFSAVKTSFELLADGTDTALCAELIRPEAYLLQFELAKPKAVKTIETAFKQAGIELATKGFVSEETFNKAKTPLSIDMEHFKKYSEVYWEYAISFGAEASNLDKVQKAVVGDMRILMSEMARSFDPIAGAKLKAVIQFDFPDRDQHFRFEINKGICVMTSSTSDKFDLRVTVDASLWAKLFTRELNVRDALMKKQIILEGDKMLFTRFDRYFPPPV